ncbi:MAG: DciA family protein [Candidatus Orphnella occulta]|nr:DciA family protein [Candidatus Orphnella occulta]
MEKKAPTLLKEILKTAIKQAEEQKKGLLTEEEVQAAWLDAAGENAAKHTKPKKMTKTTLVIDVDSPTWIYQLNINKSKIEKRLNRYFKNKKPITIKFRAGEC